MPPLSVFSKFLDKRFEISAQDFLTFPNFYLGTLKKKIGTIDLLDHRKHDRFSEGPRGGKIAPPSQSSRKRFEISGQDFPTFPNFYLGTLQKGISIFDPLDHQNLAGSQRNKAAK